MRTVLYANRQVSELLNSQFVLAWTSERPVPKVTIDFGDGRKLERTITGNAVHYVLDATGTPLEVLPGLYAPERFAQVLATAATLHTELMAQPAELRAGLLQGYHRSRQALAEADFSVALELAGVKPGEKTVSFLEADEHGFAHKVDSRMAARAVERAVGKSRVEQPMLVLISRYDYAAMEAAATDDVWRKIAYRELREIALDSRSLALMAREVQGATVGMESLGKVRRAAEPFAAEKAIARAMSKMVMSEGPIMDKLTAPESALAGMVGKFEEALAIDTVRNEYLLRLKATGWLAAGEAGSLDALNERVYRELFLTPRSDPWLGLVSDEAFTGIDAGGRR
mgnify:CR=1 FL=1